MSDKKSLQPLQKTHESLQQIKTALTPFLTLLHEYHHQSSDSSQIKQFDKQEIAEAEAAVSLAMGTLRYMAQRLKGQGQSSKNKKKKQKDPLRLELDKMRRTLVECKSLRNSDNGTGKGGDDAKRKNQSGKKKEGSASKRRRSGDEKDTSTTNKSPGKKLKIK